MIVYKSQGIDWHPQSDSLGVSPLRWTQSSSWHSLVVQAVFWTTWGIDLLFGCFIRIRLCSTPHLILHSPAFAHKPVHCTISSKVATRGTHTSSALSTHLLSQVSPCFHQCCSQYDWEATCPPLHHKGWAHTQDCASSERALGRGTGMGSSRKYSTGSRAWRGHQPSLLSPDSCVNWKRIYFLSTLTLP